MATTAINNYFDFKRATRTYGFNYESHNAIVSNRLKEGTVKATIGALLFVASVVGFLLFLNTSIIILGLGAISFAIGVLYSYGPLPISRTPLGELLSGFFMGFIILFISVYIHIYDQNFINIMYLQGTLRIDLSVIELIYIFMLSVPIMMGIANIMLANNICDIEDDIENRRYTMPVYVGRSRALFVFKALYYIGYIDLIILLILKVVPLVSVVALLTFIPVSKNIKVFYKKQLKSETFSLSVKNFLMQGIAIAVTIGIGLVI